MRVVNVSGITYGFSYNGRTIIIPYDERVYTLPNDVDMNQFGKAILVLEPPPSKHPAINVIENKIEDVVEVKASDENTNNNTITIDLSDIVKKEVVEKPVVVKKATKKTNKTVKKSF